ncbi:hypothetical protein Nazgul22 [Burkholderia phage BcepNazgul]|uniref:Uncharacterized protein n=1 Tax=Burkholderia phage BcepNazgul TaxID=242861 RepID=Q6UYL8_9CAUD|nr:hypothetical protein Nazgul22 [Burkholderia phage BcepNazgul]AAQ63323.1 hypothetical protein Nazgul22 [Burkholderia phage BcepNazgul]
MNEPKNDGVDQRAYAYVPASVLLEMKQYMDKVSKLSKVPASAIGLKERVKGLLAEAKEHVATVDLIEYEVGQLVGKYFEKINFELIGDVVVKKTGEFKGDLGPFQDELCRMMRHIALKVLGEKIERDDAAAVSKLERLYTHIDAVAAMLANDEYGEPQGTGDEKFDALVEQITRLHSDLNESAQLMVPVSASAEAELARITEQLEEACDDIEKGRGLTLDVEDAKPVHRFKQLYAKLFIQWQEATTHRDDAEGRLNAIKTVVRQMRRDVKGDGALATGVVYDDNLLNEIRGLAHAVMMSKAFGYGKLGVRHEIGVFLNHVLPRVRNPNYVGDPELIDQILDGIALVGSGSADAFDTAQTIGEDPLSQVPLNVFQFKARVAAVADSFEKHSARLHDHLGMKWRLIEVKEALGLPFARDIVRVIGEADDLASVPHDRVRAVCVVCEYVLAAVRGFDDNALGAARTYDESAGTVTTQEPDELQGDALPLDSPQSENAIRVLTEQLRKRNRLLGNFVGIHPVLEELQDAVHDILLEHKSKRPDVLQNAWFADVLKFNLAAGRSIDDFNPRMIGLHTGLQCEELGEKLRAIVEGTVASGVSLFEGMPLVSLCNQLKWVGDLFKQGAFDNAIDRADPVELADGDIDQMVVSFGSLHSQGVSLFPILHAVTDANLRKMVNGKLLLDNNGKIVKPDGWKPADLLPFLHKTKQPAELHMGPSDEAGSI